jgi:hypothetical protein
MVVSAVPAFAQDKPADAATKDGEAQGASMTKINKELTNPVSSLWSLSFQQNNYMLDMGPGESHWNSNLNFQPVLPVALTESWNLITRPVMTLFSSARYLYDLSRRFSIKGGYRAMGVDYENGSGTSKLKYDVTYYGPVVGLIARF